MKTQSRHRQLLAKLSAVWFLGLAAPLSLFAQTATPAKPPTADQFAGIYKGIAKSAAGNVDLKIEIRVNGGELYGRVSTPRAADEVFSPSGLADGKLTIKLGTAGAPETLVLQMRDGKLVGDWRVGKETRAVEFEKVVAVTPPAAPDLLSGEWEAAADAQGQAIPFNLILKLDGEKVTGSSSSHLGDLTISSGSWKDGKLAIVLDSGGGSIAMVATMIDGKLAGDFDYNGQLQGKWVATRKNR